MRLHNAFPEWIVRACNSPLGITGTITALTYLASVADTEAAQIMYTSYGQARGLAAADPWRGVNGCVVADHAAT